MMKRYIYATILLSVISMIALNANIPIYANQQHIPPALTGLIVSLNPLMSLLFAFPFAYLSDRHSRMIVIIIGLAFNFIAALILLFFRNVEALFIVKIFEGLGFAAYLPATLAYRTDLGEKEDIGKSIGSFTAVFNFGFVIAPTITAFLGQFLGLHYVFIFVVFCTSIALIISIPMYKLHKKQQYCPLPVQTEIKSLKKSDFKTFKWPVVISIALLSFAFGYATGLYDSIWAYFMLDKGGNIFLINLTYLTYALPVALFSKLMGSLADKYKNIGLQLMLGSLIVSVVIASYGFIPTALIIMFLCSIEGAGNAIFYPSANSAIIKSVDDYFKGRAIGIFNSARTAGVFIGAIVTGYIYSYSHVLPFLINGAFILITAVIATFTVIRYKVR